MIGPEVQTITWHRGRQFTEQGQCNTHPLCIPERWEGACHQILHCRGPIDFFYFIYLTMMQKKYLLQLHPPARYEFGLAQGTGVILHSCGIEVNERGYLFLGESGAGKSTLARLWDKKMGIDVLSDDRIILRKTGGQFWMYGTPWHGEAKFISCRGVKLEKIFFLHHGQLNEVKNIHEAAAVQNLVTCAFPPFWDAKGMRIALALFSELASAVPCYRLDFRPDQSAIEFIDSQIS